MSDIGRYFSYGYTGNLTLHPNNSFGIDKSSQPLGDIFTSHPDFINGLDAPARVVQKYCQKNFFMLLTDGLPTRDRSISEHLQDYDNDCSSGGCDTYDRKPDTTYESDNREPSDYLDDVTTALFDMDLRPDLVGPDSTNPVKNNVTSYMVGFAGEGLDDNPLLIDAAGQADGQFLFASDGDALQNTFRTILSDIFSKVGSSSAATFNASSLGNGANLFLASYNSADWSGELQSRPFNQDGSIAATAKWKASEEMPAPRNRFILTADNGTGVPFTKDLLGADPDTAHELDLQRNTTTAADDGRAAGRLDYIRGDRNGEGDTDSEFRRRGSALGDIVNTTPVFVGAPGLNVPDQDPFGTGNNRYSDFAAGQAANRKSVLYVGANDGMLHGFDADTGEELIAYIPELLLSAENGEGLHYLTSQDYQHRFYVDLTATVGDVFFDNDWHTVLAGGFGAGGKGYFFLDVTDPDDFSTGNEGSLVLGEFGSDDSTHGDDLGLSFSKPKIVLLNNGRWAAVFGNGYNSKNGGAALFIYYFDDGTVRKIPADSGDAVKKNGLSTPSLFDLNGDGVADRAYAGDVQGNVWAFDLCNANATGTCAGVDTKWGMAYAEPLFSTGGEPITTAPRIVRNTAVRRGQWPNLLVLFGSGQLLNTDDLTNTTGTAYYGVWDRGQSDLTVSDLEERTLEEKDGQRRNHEDEEHDIAWNTGVGTGNKFGWYIPLAKGAIETDEVIGGERVIVESVVINDLLLFNTAIPIVSDCSSGGTGWLMAVDFLTGLAPEDFAPFDSDGDGDLDGEDPLGFAGKLSPIATIPSAPAIIAVSGPGKADFRRITAYDPAADNNGGGDGSNGGMGNDPGQSNSGKSTGRLSWEELAPY